MQNTFPYHSDYNLYSVVDPQFPNNPDAAPIDNDIFSLYSPNSINVNQQIPVESHTPQSNIHKGQKRKIANKQEQSYSPASIYSDSSNYSDASCRTLPHGQKERFQVISGQCSTAVGTPNLITSAEEGSSDDDNNDDDDDESDLALKREKHTRVEAHRRALEKAHYRELATLIPDRNDSKSTKLHHLDLLKIAADLITEMNARHKHDPLRPSNLTDNELNFLTIEASNSFLFVTTIEPPIFRIIHTTDSIKRVLNTTPDLWRGNDLLNFIHKDDLVSVRNHLMQLQRIGMKIHFECKIRQGNSTQYSSVVIDGMTKFVDHSLNPLQMNGHGMPALVAICHLPLINKYTEMNKRLHSDPQSLTFRCRCSPHDWKIFLVDRSVSTLPSASENVFRQKSILDFVSQNERGNVHQALLRSTTTSRNETVPCHFIDPQTQSFIYMSLEIKPICNAILHRTDFLELTFKNIKNTTNVKLETSLDGFITDSQAIDALFEPEIPRFDLINDPMSINNIFDLNGNMLQRTTTS